MYNSPEKDYLANKVTGNILCKSCISKTFKKVTHRFCETRVLNSFHKTSAIVGSEKLTTITIKH